MPYAAPNEATVVVCGGLGTMANAAELNGGGATKVAWDANSPSDFINTNGGPKRTATCAFTTASKNLNGTDIGNGVTVGTLCYVSTGDGAHISTGIYEITTVTDNDNIVCAQIDDDGTNDTGVTVNVGGAIDTLQNVFDNPVNNAASFSRYIYINGIVNDADGTIPVGVIIDIDVNVGSTTTMVIVVGYNSTLAAESQVVLEATADINAIFDFGKAGDLNWLIRSVDFNAAGAGKANNCVYTNSASDDRVTFENCIFRNAVDSQAVYTEGDFWCVLNSEIYGSGGGFICGGTDGAQSCVIGCSIHDNSGVGIHLEQNNNIILNNLIYDNTGIGIYSRIGSFVIMGNTCYANDGDNFSLPASASYSVVINNVAVGSTGGYGFNLNSHTSPEQLNFGYNLSAGNSSGHTDISGTFANLGIGGNIASAQAAATLFTDVTDGAEDFTPKDSDSDLYQTALDAGVK